MSAHVLPSGQVYCITEDRHHVERQMLKRVRAAGYFHAPGALLCPLAKEANHAPTSPLPAVCCVFCALEGLDAMQVRICACRVLASCASPPGSCLCGQ